MKNRIEKSVGAMVFIAVSIILLSGSCKNKGEEDTGTLIPEKAFISILEDLYLADGLLIVPEIREKFYARDSVTNYVDIINSHGYSKKSMDNTVKYYITNKPKRLISIYDQVLAKLTAMEAQLEKEPEVIPAPEPKHLIVKTSYSLPDPDGSERPGFDIVIVPHGYYNLTFTVTVYPDDRSVNPCFTAYICNEDTAKPAKPEYLPAIKYTKDGLPRTYSVSGKSEKNDTLLLKGWFYDYENRPYLPGQHAIIENVALSLSSQPL